MGDVDIAVVLLDKDILPYLVSAEVLGARWDYRDWYMHL